MPSTLPARPDQVAPANALPEIGGREGPEPTRFGDWELRGRCIDF
jgi:shikimate dehydrogenase